MLKRCYICKRSLSSDNFSKDSYAPDKLCYKCKECARDQNKKWFAANKYKRKKYEVDHAAERRELGRQWKVRNALRIFKERRQQDAKWYNFAEENNHPLKCAMCGYDRCKGAIEFHHTDPATKEFALSKLVRFSFIEAHKIRFLNELSKGIFLCSNCHKEHHYTREV